MQLKRFNLNADAAIIESYVKRSIEAAYRRVRHVYDHQFYLTQFFSFGVHSVVLSR